MLEVLPQKNLDHLASTIARKEPRLIVPDLPLGTIVQVKTRGCCYLLEISDLVARRVRMAWSERTPSISNGYRSEYTLTDEVLRVGETIRYEAFESPTIESLSILVDGTQNYWVYCQTWQAMRQGVRSIERTPCTLHVTPRAGIEFRHRRREVEEVLAKALSTHDVHHIPSEGFQFRADPATYSRVLKEGRTWSDFTPRCGLFTIQTIPSEALFTVSV